VPLTFYETLPKGSKSLIGTGINAPKEKAPQSVKMDKPVTSLGTKAEKSAAPAADAHPSPLDRAEPHKETPPVTAKEPVKKGSEQFIVQVASSKERKDADEIINRLTAKGIAAYVAESKVEGKGTWYRVRVGRHLSRQEADALATKLGKGALVIPE
jgi:cell division septation protein DedD